MSRDSLSLPFCFSPSLRFLREHKMSTNKKTFWEHRGILVGVPYNSRRKGVFVTSHGDQPLLESVKDRWRTLSISFPFGLSCTSFPGHTRVSRENRGIFTDRESRGDATRPDPTRHFVFRIDSRIPVASLDFFVRSCIVGRSVGRSDV